jgi:glycerol-3-phosphate dehydrogenase (NAD(P)+)
MTDVIVFGSGAWGAALASTWACNGLNVMLWAFPEDAGVELGRTREHPRLPGGRLPESLKVVTGFKEDFQAELWASAMPTQISPAAWREMLGKTTARPRHFVHVSKGILASADGAPSGTLGTLSGALEPILGLPVGVLSGPTFADEVFCQKPSAIVLAMPHSIAQEEAVRMQAMLATPRLRVYLSRDVLGVELCGALKNILAIAGGLLDSLGLGLNARAAMLTRGLAEMARFVEKLGGQPETVMGLAGMGDLLLTATGPQSRNRTFGELLGKGSTPAEAFASMGEQVVEGAHTAKAALELAKAAGIDMPIAQEVVRLLDGEDPKAAVDNLMKRGLKAEW